MRPRETQTRTDAEPLLSEFRAPDREYGPVPLWWWDGDHFDTDRMTEQLEALVDNGVPAVCFISKYPNGPEGNRPKYFTDEWWDHMEFVAERCSELGMELWVHDETYHHSPPSWREFWQDHIKTESTEEPGVRGEVLDRVTAEVAGGETASIEVPDDLAPVATAAYPRSEAGGVDVGSAIDLDVEDGTVEWTAPEGDTEYHVAVVGRRPGGLCYTSRDAVDRYIDLHYEEYVRRLGDLVGETLVGTFEDELVILDDEVPCDDAVLERFETRGHSRAELVALYEDAAGDTDRDRVRADYYGVVVELLEENWFEPLYEWHEDHGLLRSHDNWGRNDLAAGTEQYGDYYRTMRWYQVPGYDDGGPAALGERNFFDAKLAASIAACYDRDRVWGELFHSTSWGFRPESQFAGIVENVCYGCNLYDKHGLYYSTLGGWWAHAPPDVHFRQPYWDDVGDLNRAATRLSQLFSRGSPVVDVALPFPVASMHADWHPDEGIGERGQRIDRRTRELTAELYDGGTDLVLVDDGSIAEATVEDGHLRVGEMEIPALVFGPTAAVRADTLATAREFYDAGGVVIAVDGLPDRVVGDGATDADLEATLERVFGDAVESARAGDVEGYVANGNDAGGVGVLAGEDADLPGVVAEFLTSDLRVGAPDVPHAHREVGDDDAYLLFNAREERRSIEVGFRADGSPERWDPLTGEAEPVHERRQDGPHTVLDLEFAPYGHQLVVFRGGTDEGPRVHEAPFDVVALEQAGDGNGDGDGDGRELTLRGRGDESGTVRVVDDGEERTARVDPGADAPPAVDASDGWTFELEPTMDNEWGDFRYPRSADAIGPEVRRFRHRAERPDEDGRDENWYRSDLDDGDWETVDRSYGPYCWRHVGEPDATPDEDPAGWERYEFSTDVGKPGTHEYLLGYTSVVSDEFLVSGEDRTHFWTTVEADEQTTALCHYGPGIERIVVGSREIVTAGDGEDVGSLINRAGPRGGGTVSVRLPAGNTAVHAVASPDVETHLAFETAETADGDRGRDRDMTYVPRLRWFHDDGALGFDPDPWTDSVGWYRFEVPAGTAGFTVPVAGDPTVWVDGHEREVDGGRVPLDADGQPRTVAVRVDHASGEYGGAAWTAPVAIETAPVTVDAGDWRDLGLESYSGAAVYSREIEVPEFDPGAGDAVVLDLGDVAVTASVSIEGEPVGTAFARPFEIEVTEHVTPGTNRVEIRVANTLANHFETETPKQYVELSREFFAGDVDLLSEVEPRENQFASGLRGPVTVRVEPGTVVEL